MDSIRTLDLAHPDPAIEAIRPYISSVARALLRAEIAVVGSWLDPYDPRDATVQIGQAEALVWDEVSGWRHGEFVSGRPGVRTILAGTMWLGGGLLPPGDEVAARLMAGVRADRPVLRHWNDLDDGFEERLRRAGGLVLA